MPIDTNDPEFRKAVAAGVKTELDARAKAEGLKKDPTNYKELEDRLTERISDRVIEKLGGLDDPEGGQGGATGLGKIHELFFGKQAASQ